MEMLLLTDVFHLDRLALVMIGLVGFLALCVAVFAERYLQGDAAGRRFRYLLGGLVASVMVMVSADHLLVLLVSWALGNLFLVLLMVHKPLWRAARAAGALAAQNFLIGLSMVAAAFALLFQATGETSIQAILAGSIDPAYAIAAAALLLVGAMTQSAIWPFHRWLTSSLNSPTPVSAIMHAGLVNAGGFLLARFAPLYFELPGMLTIALIAGMVSALLGTLWKLMQQDIKRMLACSTMAQMGFMMVQCGLGLFPAAVAHLCWHGMYKAFLFLNSGGAARDRRLDREGPPDVLALLASLACGAAGSYGFAAASGKPWLPTDTTLVLVGVAFVAGAQFALAVLRRRPLARLPLALALTGAMGLVYGGSVRLVEAILAPDGLAQPLPLNAVHLTAIFVLLLAWLAMTILRREPGDEGTSDRGLALYVKALNASQPHTSTVTAQRNHYNPV